MITFTCEKCEHPIKDDDVQNALACQQHLGKLLCPECERDDIEVAELLAESANYAGLMKPR